MVDFDNDVFISYAHIDNQPLVEDQDGWISLLHQGLEIRLAQLLGEKPRIWRDPKLQGNDYFSDTILEQVPKVALLVSILSPRYLKSEWCMRELRHFFDAAEANGGVRLSDNKARVFKLVKTFVPYDQHPPELGPLLGYEFYEFDESKRPREFGKIFGSESERKFWAKLEDVAYDIQQALDSLSLEAASEVTNDEAAPPTPEKTVYLAEVTADLEDERDKIRRELLQRYRVVPERSLPTDINDTAAFEAQVREYLEQSDLSVHLLSAKGNPASSGPPGLAELQQQMRAARSREQVTLAGEISRDRSQNRPEFSRILWMPPNASLDEADSFIQRLQSEPDFLRTNLESLKTLIGDRLTQSASPATFDIPTGDSASIYLDCDERDLENPEIEPLYEWLDERFSVVLPDFEGSSVTNSEALLKQCEAVLIYYGQASGLWLKRRLLAMKKTLYGRQTPLRVKAVYVAAPTKQQFSDGEVQVIEGFGGFQPTLLEEFVAALTSGRV
ncbi:MAG: toll/interleukin-1 receptor domain-containing protein [Cyanobacteria bacterium P01_A01_bin.135]